ncbi:MAG: prepilin-type N-terminal cleavage/methylation domain-containing protein [Gemmatimonadaceae bacterium]|nr:prepilin-type N-terminal cleavage/methylation domain-containing protein [Gemmatimonadaceae bacterium]NUQ91750.1 prepilin-type N-terminal cleavage/methylation domain-containing protein [Gemmatimonadaceae bacterium]NUR20244.1 prepilin-type N-terminal cleavage/methylation domain-containing protein [Gemmatimonadaceae bacterium]NUS98200.1 prepilin-type N-terminal cleavage/methylation domain-containing protein [Gemmatimonadaceae bacterium]
MSTRTISPDRAPAPSRGGFTIVELMVAMMVFGIGVLGLAATTATVTRLMGSASRQTLAAAIAQSRIEKLRGTACASLASGSDTVRGITSTWTVTTATRGVSISETVSFPTARGTTRTRVYNTMITC